MFLIKYVDRKCSRKGNTAFSLNLQESIHDRSSFPCSATELVGKLHDSRFSAVLHQRIPSENTVQGTQAQRRISGHRQ